MNAPNFLKLITATAMVSGSLFAQTPAASTDPVGFVSTTVPAQSDAVLAVPLYRAAEFKGVIQSISGNVLTVSGTPNWTANQFVQALPGQTKTYAVLIASGTKEGMIGRVTANGTSTLTVTLDSGDDLTGVKTEALNPGAADQVDVISYWTASSLIGLNVPNGTQILKFDGVGAGVNKSSSGSLGFDSGSWIDEDSFDSADHAPLSFGRAFILRNNSNASLTVSMVGSVPMTKHRVLLKTLAGSLDQDIMIGFSSPVPQLIGTIGLGFAEDDQLLVFNNSTSGKNKSAQQVFFYTTGDGWVDDGFNPVGSTFSLEPGKGYIFRKKATSTPTTLVWTGLQSYLQ